MTELLDDVFSGVVDRNDVIKIDRLVLNIGSISEHKLEGAIEDAIRRELPLIFSKLVTKEEKAIRKVSFEKSNFQLMDYFLKNGYFPWWVPNNREFNIDALIEEILLNRPLLAKQFFEQNLRSSKSRKKSSTASVLRATISGGGVRRGLPENSK